MYSGKQALRLEKFKASDIGGLDKELKKEIPYKQKYSPPSRGISVGKI